MQDLDTVGHTGPDADMASVVYWLACFFVCRMTEAVTHYGESIKAIMNEELGDGIMSAIDMYATVRAYPNACQAAHHTALSSAVYQLK